MTPPYIAVIFSSQRRDDDEGYAAMAERMVALAATQPGFLGIESARSADGFGITVAFTVLSLVRGYALRRVFNRVHSHLRPVR